MENITEKRPEKKVYKAVANCITPPVEDKNGVTRNCREFTYTSRIKLEDVVLNCPTCGVSCKIEQLRELTSEEE